jgi:hypothetical protein
MKRKRRQTQNLNKSEFPQAFNRIGSLYIREVSYKYGNKIYLFMEKHNIGKNYYGKLMDSAAKGKNVIAHRLYGHHFIYDMPIENPKYIVQFYEHLFSDLFTKQGIPILPGEILEDAGLLKACDKLTRNWNFVNGFDILAATVSLYSAVPKFMAAIQGKYQIRTVEQLATKMGVGAIELAIAMTSANPFLLIGAILELTSNIIGLFSKGDKIFLNSSTNYLRLSFTVRSLSLKFHTESLSIENATRELSLENSLHSLMNPFKSF